MQGLYSSEAKVILRPTKKENLKCPLFGSIRLTIALLALLCTCLQCSHKMDINVNIICMVNHSALSNQLVNPNSSLPHIIDGPFIWSKPVQGLIISVFSWGYLISQIPSGLLASQYGAKWVITYGMIINGICTLFYKRAAYVHYSALMFLRFLVGIGTGVVFPSISQLWAHWAPTQEKSFLMAVSVSGSHLGSVFTLILAGHLCSNTFQNKWHYLFYIIGISSLIWAAIWSIIYTNSPVTQRCMTAKEKAYIMQNISKPRINAKCGSRRIPWSAIMRSTACWSQFLCHMSMNWGYVTLFTYTPTYMSEILQFNIKTNGMLSSIAFIMIWLFAVTSSYLCDRIIENQILSRTNVRKIVNVFGSLLPASALFGLCFVTKSSAGAGIVLLSFGMGTFGVAYGSGFLCVCNDMSTKYASIIFGISNTLATMSYVSVPLLVSRLTRNKTIAEWRTVFILTAIIWFIGGLQFAIFGVAETQNFDKDTNTFKEETIKLNRSNECV